MALTFGQQPQAPAQDALAAEEARLRQQAAQQQVMPGFAEACARIQISGQGFPRLGGAAAQMYAAAGGQSIAPGVEFPGQGKFAQMPVAITDPAHVLQLANEIAPAAPVAQTPPVVQQAQQPAFVQPAPAVAPMQWNTNIVPWSPQAVQHILPPDAPASQPHLAAKPVEGFPMPQAPQVQAMQMAQQAFGATTLTATAPPTFTFPPAQQTQGQAAPTSPTPSSVGATASPAAPAPSPEPKKRGPKPKGQRDTMPADVPGTVTVNVTSGYAVFVDCTPNVEAESLHPYVDEIVNSLVQRFCPPPALPDLRCAPKDGPLGFGGWRGALRAIVLEKPPAAGTYQLRARGDEIAEEVAAAMLTVCNKTGGLYVR